MTPFEKETLRRMRENGGSYGQIAATLGLSENTVKSCCRRMSIRNLAVNTLCPACGKPSGQGGHGQRRRFCSDACRYAWSYAHQVLGPHNAVYRKCACCGKGFFSYPSGHRKYCSHACYIADRYGKEARRHEQGAC